MNLAYLAGKKNTQKGFDELDSVITVEERANAEFEIGDVL